MLIDGVRVNLYGGHIFHTNSERIWKYASRFTEWRQYEHRVKAYYKGMAYSFPPNLMTYQQMGMHKDDDRLEDRLREMFFRGYSEKQWGKPLEEIPQNILKRIPMRRNWDDRYFTDKYQGLPLNGYTAWIKNMFADVEIVTEVDYLDDRGYWTDRASKVIYTGEIDRLYGYELGKLEYRSLRFETEPLLMDDWQGCATMNYTDKHVAYTRVMEWKYFGDQKITGTVITREYPADEGEPYYPVNDEKNNRLADEYKRLAERDGIYTGGRLGSYRYYNMDQVIGQALDLCARIRADA